MEVSFCTLRVAGARDGDAAASGRCANAREACEVILRSAEEREKVHVRAGFWLASRP